MIGHRLPRSRDNDAVARLLTATAGQRDDLNHWAVQLDKAVAAYWRNSRRAATR